MKYMLLLNRMADALPEPGTPELDRINSVYAAAVAAMGRAGVLVDCAPLAAWVIVVSAAVWPRTYRSKNARVMRATSRSTGLSPVYGTMWSAPYRSR